MTVTLPSGWPRFPAAATTTVPDLLEKSMIPRTTSKTAPSAAMTLGLSGIFTPLRPAPGSGRRTDKGSRERVRALGGSDSARTTFAAPSGDAPSPRPRLGGGATSGGGAEGSADPRSPGRASLPRDAGAGAAGGWDGAGRGPTGRIGAATAGAGTGTGARVGAAAAAGRSRRAGGEGFTHAGGLMDGGLEMSAKTSRFPQSGKGPSSSESSSSESSDGSSSSLDVSTSCSGASAAGGGGNSVVS